MSRTVLLYTLIFGDTEVVSIEFISFTIENQKILLNSPGIYDSGNDYIAPCIRIRFERDTCRSITLSIRSRPGRENEQFHHRVLHVSTSRSLQSR